MTTDWRLYEMLTYDKTKPFGFKPGDEPTIRNKVTIRHGGRDVVVPLPPDAVVVEIEAQKEANASGPVLHNDGLIPELYQPTLIVEPCQHKHAFKVRLHDESGGGYAMVCNDCGWCDAVEEGRVCGHCIRWSRVRN